MKIAFLCTGDEIVGGDTLNSNSPTMARELIARGYDVGAHLSVADDDKALLDALTFLFHHHDVVISIGGLGPTSDDRTRFAVANYFNEELHFFDACWQGIVARHQAIGLETPDNNRQQALFPKTATIFANPFGTASGCAFKKNNKFVFLLPGPPSECLPMFDKGVLKELEAVAIKQKPPLRRWLVFNTPESQLAHQVEQALSDVDCTIGYRLCWPYIELKVTAKTADERELHERLASVIAKESLFKGTTTALSRLKESLQDLQQPLLINDKATSGHFESRLVQPGDSKLTFQGEDAVSNRIEICGLAEYWAGKKEGNSLISISLEANGKVNKQQFNLNLKRRFLLDYVVELLAITIQNWLIKQGLTSK